MLLSSKKNEYYWSIVIEPGWVQAAVWTITEDKKTDVLAIGPAVHWDEETDLPNSADTSLSGAVQNLPEDAPEPSKTVFGVPPSWVTEGAIGKDHLEKIRELCSKLSLEPSGFVVLSEAIAHFKRTEEGTPLNAIIVGVGSDTIDVTVFRLGTLTGSVNIARSVSPLDDVKEGLSKFASTEALPSRFLLYDGREGELEDVKQALIKGDWSGGNDTFLHTPQVEIIDPDKKVLAVCLAGAAEIGQATGLAVSVPAEMAEKSQPEEMIDAEHANVGAAGDDIKPEDFGFAVGKDLSQADTQMPPPPIPPPAPVGPAVPQIQMMVGLRNTKIADFLRKVKLSVVSFFAKSGGAFTGSNILLPGAIFLFLLLIGGFIAWWFLPKAEVVIYVSPQKIEEATTIFVDPKLSAPNLATRTIPGDVLRTTVSGDKTRDTTGTKTVGDKAKGEVTLYRPGAEVTLASGTALAGPNGLKFVLDDSVTVASGSATSPGTANAKVTANDIGAEYNLAAGSTFGVGNYPSGDLEAKNSTAFTGGSSREITAVSQEDRDKLEKDLKEELVAKAKVELKEKLTADQSFIEDAVTATVSSRTFNRKVGDEAGNLKLSMTLEVSGLVATKSHLTDIARELLKDQAPGGFVLRDDQIGMEFDVEGEKKGIWEIGVSFAANLLPEVKTDDIARAISGKYPNVVQSYLASIPGYVRAEIKFIPPLPGKLGSLPRVVKNITVEVAAER